MRISVLTSTFPPYKGGMGNVAFNEVEFLGRMGFDVVALTPLYGNTDLAADSAAERHFSLVRLPSLMTFGNAAFCAGFLKYIEQTDIVYLHYPFFGVAEIVWLNRVLGAPNIRRGKLVVRYDMDVVGTTWKRMLFLLHTKFIMPAILNSADKVIFSTADYAATSNAAWLVHDKPEKCAEIPYGVDTTRYYPDQSAVKHAKTILFVGGLDRTHYFKGVDNLIMAVAPLIQTDRAIRLVVVGKGDMAPHYQTLAQALQISENVCFLADCDDHELRKRYSEATVTVLPSVDRSEAFGLVLLESQACGTPVIASALPGVRTLIQDGVNGYLTGNPESMAPDALQPSLRTAIKKILDAPDHAANMGKAGRQSIVERYSWQVVAGRLAQCLLE